MVVRFLPLQTKGVRVQKQHPALTFGEKTKNGMAELTGHCLEDNERPREANYGASFSDLGGLQVENRGRYKQVSRGLPPSQSCAVVVENTDMMMQKLCQHTS